MKFQSKNIYQKLLKRYLILVSVQKPVLVYFIKFFNEYKGFLYPPIFNEKKIITDLREKAELINSLLVNQCSLIKNTSVLPTICENITDKSLPNITLTENEIGKIQ